MSESAPTILYCHCQYAQVVPKEVKESVLRSLCESGVAFHAVADLCEASARRDPLLQQVATSGCAKIAACFPRAVKGLFHQAGADFPETGIEILNMRVQSAAEVAAALLGFSSFGLTAAPPATGVGDAPEIRANESPATALA